MSMDDQIKQAAEAGRPHGGNNKVALLPGNRLAFWLDWAKEQDWNPLEEVSCRGPLRSFPTFRTNG